MATFTLLEKHRLFGSFYTAAKAGKVWDLSTPMTINHWKYLLYQPQDILLQPNKNLVHIQKPFVSELFLSPVFMLFAVTEHYQTGFYFILDWTVTKRWSDLFIWVVCSWLQSWLALVTTMFHFVARLSPLRGACLPALCQARTWHTHTRTIFVQLRFQYLLWRKKFSCSVFPMSSCWETRSSGQI